ncbi:hypothetical protein B0H14DRAFT_3088117 [Mycena olivaceomarginata]|nr:hypothetical protein B0H14DRAFT_3088117 [Mycena olivaceomarginata]
MQSVPPFNQQRLRQPHQSAEQITSEKFEFVDKLLGGLGPFESLGEFLAFMFFNRVHGETDPRGESHAIAVAKFLRGSTTIRMSHILPLIYKHRNSFPSINSLHSAEQNDMFSDAEPPKDIHHTRPFISTWALRLTAAEARKQIWDGTRDDPDDPDDHVQLQAQTNGRGKGKVITREDMSRFSIASRQRVPMFLTKYMSAPRVKGVFVVRAKRPYPMIQVSAIASFIVARNCYANGDFAIIFGVWHLTCKSHINVKRIYCRLGSSVSDTSRRASLTSIATSSITELRGKIQAATEQHKTTGCIILDNVQEYVDVYEQGIGRQSQLKVGTAATWVGLQDCAPGAFDAADYYARIALKQRKGLTFASLFDDLDWEHIERVTNLHWVRVLVEFVPELKSLLPRINNMFRSDPIAKHRMRADRPANFFQPLGTNSEHETETQGMERAVRDFETQLGMDPDADTGLLTWIRGDGALYANLLRLNKYCAPLGKFKNKIMTPEIWHTGATDLNSIAANHYGLATSSDPSSLSKSSNAAGFKRPSNIKSCDYYPTMRNFTLIWTAHVLDCWRPCWQVFFNTEDLLPYFLNLSKMNKVPTLDHSLSASEATSNKYNNQVPQGTPWTGLARSSAVLEPPPDAELDDLPDLVEIQEPTAVPEEPGVAKEAEEGPKHHEEHAGFTGDRVLRNSQIFMMDMGWWIEMAHAVPEGDISRIWEILKIWIFKFAGSSHQNYMAYLLEDLQNTILNNWLVNVEGELGKYLPGDLHQEHYNRWLKDMARMHGGEFDDKYYRETLSPNIHHFLRIKEEITTAFSLKRRSKTHTSPHLRNKLHLLLTMFKEQEVHLFRSGRSMGHAAVNQFARSCRRLEGGKLEEWLDRSLCLGDFLEEFNRSRDLPNTSLLAEPASLHDDSDSDSESARGSSSPLPQGSSSPARSDSPPPSGRDSVSSRSQSSASNRSTTSNHPPDLNLSFAEPHEPEDLSHCKLSSGSFKTTYVDQDTGFLEYGDDEEDKDLEGDGEQGDEEGKDEEEVEFEGTRTSACDGSYPGKRQGLGESRVRVFSLVISRRDVQQSPFTQPATPARGNGWILLILVRLLCPLPLCSSGLPSLRISIKVFDLALIPNIFRDSVDSEVEGMGVVLSVSPRVEEGHKIGFRFNREEVVEDDGLEGRGEE